MASPVHYGRLKTVYFFNVIVKKNVPGVWLMLVFIKSTSGHVLRSKE
jgi:hypothetical protein